MSKEIVANEVRREGHEGRVGERIRPEERTLRRSSKGELVVALPRQWLDRNLAAGVRATWQSVDAVTFLLHVDAARSPPDTLDVDLGEIRTPEQLLRELVAAYLGGAREVHLKASGSRPSSFALPALREFLRRAPRWEVVEQDPRGLHLRDVSDPDSPEVSCLLRRMFLLVEEVHRRASRSWKDPDPRPERWAEQDNEVDRLAWMVERRLVLGFPGSRDHGPFPIPDPAETCYKLLATRALERLADHAARLGVEGSRLGSPGLDNPLLQQARRLQEKIPDLIAEARGLWSEPHRAAIHDLADGADSLRRGILTLQERLFLGGSQASRLPLSHLPSVLAILDSVERSAGYLEDLAEILLDRQSHHLIRDERPPTGTRGEGGSSPLTSPPERTHEGGKNGRK
jgi:phosphate uptake regulator